MELKRIEIEQDLCKAKEEIASLQIIYNQQNDEVVALKAQSEKIQYENDLAMKNFGLMQEEAKKSAELVYNANLELISERFDKSIEDLREKYNEDSQVYQDEYLNTLKEMADNFQEIINEKAAMIAQEEQYLADIEKKVHAATEVNKTLELEIIAKDFYRLCLSNEDLEEIKKLRSIEPYLRNAEPLNKIIWKVYYQVPYSQLIGRVVGAGKKTGIYKITEIETGKCYIGQAVDIAERWSQHIKRGLGADTPTKNKLYPALKKIGPENFTFEIIEECPREQLNTREDYWQDFYDAKTFGYSIK